MTDPCPTCNGDGESDESPLAPCPTCLGSGRADSPQPDTAPEDDQWAITVTVPARLSAEARDALFNAVADTAHRWEDPHRTGWDIDVSGGPVADALNGAPATPAERAVIDAAEAWSDSDAVCQCENTPEGKALLDAVATLIRDEMIGPRPVAGLRSERNKTDGG